MKRSIGKYAKESPHLQIEEYDLDCSSDEIRHLFEVEDDHDMIFIYEIKSKEQLDFFKQKGFDLDLSTGFYFVECYEE